MIICICCFAIIQTILKRFTPTVSILGPNFKHKDLIAWDRGKIKIHQVMHQEKLWTFMSGSSLGTISWKCQKVPHSSVQTIKCKYKHNGVSKGRRQLLCLRNGCSLVLNMQKNHRPTAKDVAKMNELVTSSRVKHSLHQYEIKGC